MDTQITRIEIVKNPHFSSPREWDNLGMMVCIHRQGRAWGDKSIAPSRLNTLIAQCNRNKWVYCYVHSLPSPSVIGRLAPDVFSRFPIIGINYVTDTKLIEEYGEKNEKTIALAIAVLESEIETYGQFLSGDVWGFRAYDGFGQEVDSCYDFYGSDPFENGMSDHLDPIYHPLLKAAAGKIKGN